MRVRDDLALFPVGCILLVLSAVRFKELALNVQSRELLEQAFLLLNEFRHRLVQVDFSDVDFEHVNARIEGCNGLASVADFQIELRTSLDELTDFLEWLFFQKTVIVFDLSVQLVEVSFALQAHFRVLIQLGPVTNHLFDFEAEQDLSTLFWRLLVVNQVFHRFVAGLVLGFSCAQILVEFLEFTAPQLDVCPDRAIAQLLPLILQRL